MKSANFRKINKKKNLQKLHENKAKMQNNVKVEQKSQNQVKIEGKYRKNG